MFKNNIPAMVKSRKKLKESKQRLKEQERVQNEMYAKLKGVDYVLSEKNYRDITYKSSKNKNNNNDDDNCCEL